MATSYEAYILRLTDHREQETTEEVKVKGRETLDFNISIICMFSTLFYSQYLLIRILVMYPEYLVTLSAEKSFCPGAALPSFTSYSEEPCCTGISLHTSYIAETTSLNFGHAVAYATSDFVSIRGCASWELIQAVLGTLVRNAIVHDFSQDVRCAESIFSG
jgi:hypothetical protein